MLILLLEILKGVFVEISKDNDIGYFLPDRTNLDESTHTYVEQSDMQLAYDVGL